MFLFYALRFFKEGDTIQGGTLFKGGDYLRKYGNLQLGSSGGPAKIFLGVGIGPLSKLMAVKVNQIICTNLHEK